MYFNFDPSKKENPTALLFFQEQLTRGIDYEVKVKWIITLANIEVALNLPETPSNWEVGLFMLRTEMIYCTQPTVSCVARRHFGSRWQPESQHMAQPLSIDGSYIVSPSDLGNTQPSRTKPVQAECRLDKDSPSDDLPLTEAPTRQQGQVYNVIESHRHLMLKWKSRLQRWLYTIFYSLPLLFGVDFVSEKQHLETVIFDSFLYQPVCMISTCLTVRNLIQTCWQSDLNCPMQTYNYMMPKYL